MPHRRRNADRGAAEGGVNLGEPLFKCVFLGAERAREIAAEAGGVAGRVDLMPISA